MELKDIAEKIFKLFECKDVSEFTRDVKYALFSDKINDVFFEYKNIVPDLSVDWLQKIYQFYNADRKEKKQDYTPVCLARLVAMLSFSKNQQSVYDCCAGSGALTIQKWNINHDLKFVLEELDENILPILLFNLSIRNIQATVILKDVLSNNVIDTYKITRGNEYGIVQRQMFPEKSILNCDVSISNPPFNLRVPVSKTITKDLPEKYTCNFAFVAHCMQRTNRCAIILPKGVLSSKEEIECRKYIIEKGWLKAAISLPGRMFESTQVETCILVLDKSETSKYVMLVNAESMKSVETRNQRGEGHNSSRIYEKKFNTFSDEQLCAICQLVCIEQDKVSKKVSFEELKQNEYKLTISQYIPIELEGTIHRDFNEIISDINRVARERNVIKITVNKIWAEKLGLTQLINDCNASNEIVKSINESFKKFSNYKVKENIIDNRYIQCSNSKIFCIENTDKEILSSIMPFFINMYKQHIYYLNNEENRLLAELRDSILPLLISGDLQINSK